MLAWTLHSHIGSCNRRSLFGPTEWMQVGRADLLEQKTCHSSMVPNSSLVSCQLSLTSRFNSRAHWC
jgi:hypothetical protein